MGRASIDGHQKAKLMDADKRRYAGLVSVVTPTYNSIDTLRRAVLSVARQTLPALEHIVIDDGSTDGSLDLLQHLKKSLPHLRTVTQSNAGAGVARNHGIRIAQGRYIAFLDSDDYWRRHKLERQVAFMETTGATFSFGNYFEVENATGRVLREFEAPETLGYQDLLTSCQVGCLTAAYDQEYHGKVYMPAARRGQDWALWMALTRDGSKAYRYPGTEAVRYLSPRSLSAKKLHKAVDVYRIYRGHEGFSASRAILYLGRHSINVLRNRRLRRS
jgi:teichuronic acid biosynthesis glycosyltransferase TuaG